MFALHGIVMHMGTS